MTAVAGPHCVNRPSIRSIGPWIANCRSSKLTTPLSTYSISGSAPSIEKRAQVPQVSEPYSISLSGASGLPTSVPPSSVMTAVVRHSLPSGAGMAAIASLSMSPVSSAADPQAASARASGAARAKRRVLVMNILVSGLKRLGPGVQP